MAVASYFDTVQKIYIAFYQRPADPAGLYYWSQLLDINGGDLTAVIDGFANSAEAIRLYDKNADGAVNLDDASAMLDDVFMALFNRAPDPAGKQFYLDALTAGKFPDGRVATVGRVVLDVLNGATSADAIAVSNKLEYATAFTKTLDPELDGIGPFQATYNGDDEAGARTLLAAVTADPTTRKTAAQVAGEVQSGIADAGDPILNQQTTGQTFTLTTSIEQKTGGATDDTFSGLFGTSNTADTLNTADVLDGAAGNDTLNLIATGTFASGTATISNIETINVKDVVGASLTATIATGVKNVNFTDTIAGNTSTVTGLTDLTTVVGITGKGNLTVGYNAASVGGTADEAKVAINGIGSKAADGTITRATVDVSNANKIEKLNLAVTGDNYVNVATDTALGTITVTGAGTLNLRGAAGADLPSETTNSTLKVDASTATGAQNYAFAAGAVDVTTGTADDTIAFGSTLGSTDKINGGAGNDKLTFTLGTAVQVLPTVTDVETIEATFSAAGTLNASKITGATTLNVKGSSTVTATNLNQAVKTVNFNDNTTTGAVSLSYAAGAVSDVVINQGHINTATNGTGSSFIIGGVTLSGNAGTVTVNSIVDTDNTSAVTNDTGALDIGTATKLSLNSASKADLTVGAVTAGAATELNIAANGGTVDVGTLLTADKLTKLNIASTNDGSVTTAAIGGTKAASALTDVVVNVAGKTGATAATVNLADIAATKLNGGSGAGTSALKNVDITLGAGLTVTNLPGISGVDTSGAGTGTTDGAGIAQLTNYKLSTGAGTAVTAHATANLGARSVTNLTIDTAAAASAITVGQKFAIDESVQTVTLTAGKNVSLQVEINGLNDAEATQLYNLAIGTVTATGEGNVKIAGLGKVGGNDVIKSIASIDLSAVKGTSEVAASSLSGTSGYTILVGEGGTAGVGVNGSNKADIITGGKGADVILGGAGADQITGGLGADVITGGAGQDTIDLTESTQSADKIFYAESGSSNVDTVTGFKAGTDIVQFTIGNVDGASTRNFASAGGTDVSTAGTATAATVAVNTSAAVADAANLLFFSSTAATSFATAIGTAVITDTTGTNWTNTTSVAAVYYDSNNGQAVFGYVVDSTAAGTALTSADTFVEITRVGMTSTDYTASNIAASFAFA